MTSRAASGEAGTPLGDAELEANVKLVLSTVAVAATLSMATSAGAHIFRPGCNDKLAPKQELRCAQLNVQHALATIAWAKKDQGRITFYDASQALLLHRIIMNHRWLYRVMRARVVSARHRLVLSAFPPHHALWLCIHGGEGAWNDANSGGNGHYGGLQMHPDWGYGTSHHASDDSQMQQEWAAERAYQASGYNRDFLMQQWAADAHCF